MKNVVEYVKEGSPTTPLVGKEVGAAIMENRGGISKT